MPGVAINQISQEQLLNRDRASARNTAVNVNATNPATPPTASVSSGSISSRLKGLRDSAKNKGLAGAKLAAEKGLQEGSAWFLGVLWGATIPSFGLNIIFLNIYFFATILFPGKLADFGKDTVLGTLLGGGKIAQAAEKAGVKGNHLFAKIVEIIILVIVDILIAVILFAIFFLLYWIVKFITSPVGTAREAFATFGLDTLYTILAAYLES